MGKIKISGQLGRWTVEYPSNIWDPPVVNVFDTFEAASARAKELGRLASCGIDGTRKDTLVCLVKTILDPLPKFKRGAGRGPLVSLLSTGGGHRFVSKRTARRLGMKTPRSKPTNS